MRSSIPLDFGRKDQHDFSFSVTLAKSGCFCPEHWHDCFEIIYVTDGKLRAGVSGEELFVSKGDVLVLPPRTIHIIHAEEKNASIQVFGYTENLIASPEISMFNMKYLSLFFSHGKSCVRAFRAGEGKTEVFVSLLEEALDAYMKEGFCREILVRSKILAVHACLAEMYLEGRKERGESSKYLSDAERYIENNIGRDISPYEIAEALHVSYSHLSRIINEESGYPIGELILRMKINHAESIMTTEKEKGITEIALSVGFNSVSYFTRIFKRMRGVTPSAFRKMLRKNTDI